ncbi:helix-turn-helix domain-containing protein [Burkholderia multivorans]|uniref:helix-turn-helix domain-containing protein n=1 Tax=Burkholderia multivorans TaxID=87883 RepID=UPI001C218366|nr:helix-turn-helix domain-containing protein [Burkholderia multivorans]MBU9224077.1 helix-turn-helix domain-containing protein [Burkholderia multivorans]MBU9419882.1 helix-turn-helix domain-containing protein [Burkholderia multivorans]MBU9479722.1 helix-turn-helix domain-containing protein [Burkholderia multivorans]
MRRSGYSRTTTLGTVQKAQARQRLAQGHSVAAIARDLNTSRQTVMRIRARSDEQATG